MTSEYHTSATVIDEEGSLHDKARARLWREDAARRGRLRWGGRLELAPTLRRRAGSTFDGTLLLEYVGPDVQGILAGARLTVSREGVIIEGLGNPPF